MDLSWVTRQVVWTLGIREGGDVTSQIQPDTGPLLSSEISSRTLGCLSVDICSTKVSVEAPLMAANITDVKLAKYKGENPS